MKTVIRACAVAALTITLAACGNQAGSRSAATPASDMANPRGSNAGTTDRGAGAAAANNPGVTGITGGGGGVPRN